MSNVNKPIRIQATLPVKLAVARPEGTLMAPDGSVPTSFQTFAGVLLYDTQANEFGDVALPGSVVYARVSSATALAVGAPLKVDAGTGVYVSASVATDIVNGVLLEAHAGGGEKLVKVFVK